MLSPLFHFLKQSWVKVLAPFKLLHLGTRETVFGVLFHETDLGRPGTGEFALGFAVGPEPGCEWSGHCGIVDVSNENTPFGTTQGSHPPVSM